MDTKIVFFPSCLGLFYKVSLTKTSQQLPLLSINIKLKCSDYLHLLVPLIPGLITGSYPEKTQGHLVLTIRDTYNKLAITRYIKRIKRID